MGKCHLGYGRLEEVEPLTHFTTGEDNQIPSIHSQTASVFPLNPGESIYSIYLSIARIYGLLRR
jgi:hypothetical protein